MNYYKYTDTEIKTILKSMTIMCDTREQKNDHIISELIRLNVKHVDCKLNAGDYSVMLPAISDMGIVRPMYFDKAITIERKASLNELSGNFTKDRERLQDEFTRARDIKTFLLIEDASISDILEHNYPTELNEKAFFASLLSFQERYNLNIVFTPKRYTGVYIYSLLYYHLRNYLIGV